MLTSCFGVSASHPNAVAISRGVPRWYKGRTYMPLAPSWALIKVRDEAEYTRRYKIEVLARLDPRKVADDLGADAVLLCWERPGEFCHRRLVAAWLKETLGMDVLELVSA